MRTFSKVLVAAALAAVVLAECPGSCSGHGRCGDKDACTCEPNWIGADCSQRVCPFGLSFVDTPRGDLNHDGQIVNVASAGYTKVQWSNVAEYETFPFTFAGNNINGPVDEAHFYNECSGKGACNRESGECVCQPGFTGSACQRTTCPKDCSGHGVCRTLSEIAKNAMNKRRASNVGGVELFSGVTTAFDYNLWDADKLQACVCDPGFTGPDCTLRECPRGDDPLTTGPRYQGNALAAKNTVISFGLSVAGESTLKIGFVDWSGKQHYVYPVVNTGVDAPGAAGNPGELPSESTTSGKIMMALRAIPSGIMNRVEVFADSNAAGTRTYSVTYVGIPGYQAPLTVSTQSGTVTVSALTTVQQGNTEEMTCSGRGTCEYSTGTCICFVGYYGQSCEFQNALAGGSSTVSRAASVSATGAVSA